MAEDTAPRYSDMSAVDYIATVHSAHNVFSFIGGTMKRYLSLVAVVAVSVISASAQMVPFTSSGTSSVTPFVNLALKNSDRSEYTFGAMYMTNFGLGIQADYGVGNGVGSLGHTSNSELAVQVGYFPVWAGDKGGFNLGFVGGYSTETGTGSVVGDLTDTDYSLGLSTSYTAVVSDKLQIIPFAQLGWEVESNTIGSLTDWERGSYTAYGTHVRFGMGSNALVLTAQSSSFAWDGLNIGVRYVIAF